MTLLDAMLMVLGFFSTPFAVALYGFLLAGLGVLVALYCLEDGYIFWPIFTVTPAALFLGISLIVWAVNGDPTGSNKWGV